MPVPFDEEDQRSAREEGKKLPQYIVASLATLGAFSAGTYLSWTSPSLPLYNHPDTLHVTGQEQSWLGSLVPLGALFGALPAGMIADKLGRKRSILFVTIPLFLDWFVIGFAPNAWWLYIGRFTAGATVGATSVIVPMYVSEIAESRIRGALGTLFQLQINIGILFGYIAGMSGDLHYIAMLSASIPAILLMVFPMMPESPVWLINQGRRDETKVALQRLRGEDYQIHLELAQLELSQETQEETVGLRGLIDYKKAMMISLGLMLIQQLSGVNAVIFYAENIFIQAGSTSSTFSSVIVGLVMVLATYSSVLLVDRAGRRVLLLISASVMSVCLFALAGYFHLKKHYDLASFFWLPLLFVTLFVVAFSLGIGPIPWMMVGELFPSNVKGIASSVSAACNWTMAFAVTKLFQNMLDTIGIAFAFVIFGLVCVLGTTFIAFAVPETQGKTIEQVQIELYSVKERLEKQPNVQS